VTGESLKRLPLDTSPSALSNDDMEPQEQLEFCRSCIADAKVAMTQGRIPDAIAMMEEAKQHFFKVYWPLNGKPETGWVSMTSYPGDAMNKPIDAPCE